MKKGVIITVLFLTCLLSLNVFALNGNVDDLEAEGEKVKVYEGTAYEAEMVKVPDRKVYGRHTVGTCRCISRFLYAGRFCYGGSWVHTCQKCS